MDYWTVNLTKRPSMWMNQVATVNGIGGPCRLKWLRYEARPEIFYSGLKKNSNPYHKKASFQIGILGLIQHQRDYLEKFPNL